MNQSEIVLSLLFKANQQLAKAVKKGMSDFDHPASGLEVRIALYFFALLNGLGTACITSIQKALQRRKYFAGVLSALTSRAIVLLISLL